ncbi:MAG TPA: sigma 54-interacting transcriptional regulator [Pseudomonadota bacterium]|nr:sigma 54-interacting transcriptional regulator [Pseudomonadota bacterium]
MQTTETDKPTAAAPLSCPTLRLLYSGSAGVVELPGRVLHPGVLQLGREVAEAQGIGLPADGRASRVHATVRTDAAGQRVQLFDADSKNGSFVNGQRVKESPLADGDVVRVGNSLLLLRYEPARQVDAVVPRLLGSSPAIRAVRDAIAQAAQTGASVLLLGESGTGKEVAAQALHQLGGRKGPLVAVNCAAIPAELAESQLFGHIAGAFTGARAAQDGYFRSADGGTLFLDEIGELPLALQAKLLRVLEDKRVCPVGSNRPVAVDAWLLAATNRDLIDSVTERSFRGDLYARLAQIIIDLPPLRQRREDVLPLLLHLLGLPAARLSVALAEALLLHPFPFNVRELVQLAAQLRLAARGASELDLPMVAERLSANAKVAAQLVRERSTAPFHEPTPEPADSAEYEASPRQPPPSREELVRLLQEHKGHISRVAQAIGRSRRQVDRLLQQHGLARKDFLD